MAIVAVYLTAMIVASTTSTLSANPTNSIQFIVPKMMSTNTTSTTNSTAESTGINTLKPKTVNQLESSIIYENTGNRNISFSQNSQNGKKENNKSTSKLSNKINAPLPTPFGKYALTTIITDGKKSMIIVYPTGELLAIVVLLLCCIFCNFYIIYVEIAGWMELWVHCA